MYQGGELRLQRDCDRFDFDCLHSTRVFMRLSKLNGQIRFTGIGQLCISGNILVIGADPVIIGLEYIYVFRRITQRMRVVPKIPKSLTMIGVKRSYLFMASND